MFTIQQFADSTRLPTLPEVALKLVKIAQLDEPNYREISTIIRSDPVISGKILKTANSALFGFSYKIESIEQAIPKLGLTLLRTLILSFHLASHRTHQKQLEPVLQDLWRSSLTQASFAELIAEEFGVADPATCFLAGMLQDIGILAMISEEPVDYLEKVFSRLDLPNVTGAERSHFGFSHVEVSTEIIRKWGLEESFGDAIRHHHDKVTKKTPISAQQLKIVLQAANLGTAVLAAGHSPASLNNSLDQWISFMSFQFGQKSSQAEEMITEVNQRVSKYSTLFEFDVGDHSKSDQVMAAAKEMLQEIALRNQVELMAGMKSKKVTKDEDNELFRDSLSGLFNRRFMNERLNDQLARRIKNNKPIALLFMDVDKFKIINDSFGHSAGDKAIRHVANWLTHSIRADDLAIRLGGDEFLVILQSVDEDDSEQIAHRIVNEIPPFELPDGRKVEISLSLGCAIYQPQRGDGTDANWLIDQADQSMYDAKNSGGGSVSIQKFVGSGQVMTK